MKTDAFLLLCLMSISVTMMCGCGKGLTAMTGTPTVNPAPTAPVTDPTPTAPIANPASLPFSSARGTQSAVQIVSIEPFSGDAITASLATGTQFRITTANSCPKSADICQIGVTFAPSETGTLLDSLILTDAKTGLITSVILTGQPLYYPPNSSATDLTFGDEEIGLVSAAQTITVAAQYLDSLSFTIQPALDFTLLTGAACAQGVPSCQIGVAFNPIQDGPVTGTLLVTDSVNETSSTVSLSGNGFGNEGAMSGLDYYLPFTDGSGTTVSDASGNHRDGVIAGTGKVAVWAGGVGLTLYDQILTIPETSGRPMRGLCAYFPATYSDLTQYKYLYSISSPQGSGQSFDSYSGSGDQGHGTDADFPAVGYSNGATRTASLNGFSGVHCEEEIVGTGPDDLDRIIVDGQEVAYDSQSFSSEQINAAGLTAPMFMSSDTSGFTQRAPIFFSAWGSTIADTVQKAKTRTLSELARLTSDGIAVIPGPSLATDSTCSITGTSIDLGAGASQSPSALLALDFPCTINNLAVSGQAPKDMAGSV